MRLNYFMKGFEPVPAIDIDLEDPNQIHWLHAIVAENPEVIFFFTIATTDIWEKEWDYNEYAMPVPEIVPWVYNPESGEVKLVSIDEGDEEAGFYDLMTDYPYCIYFLAGYRMISEDPLGYAFVSSTTSGASD